MWMGKLLSGEKNRSELIEPLEKIPNQYPNFIIGMIFMIRNYQIGTEVRQFLIEHPDASTDDVIDFADSLVNEDD